MGVQFTKENASEMGKRGNIASQKAKLKKRKIKETLEILLKTPIKSKSAGDLVDAEHIENLAQVKHINIDAQTAMAIAMIRNAANGDVRAAEFVRDTMGQKPKNEIDIEGNLPIVIVDDLNEPDKQKDNKPKE